MDYQYIKDNKNLFLTGLNQYVCPVCNKISTSKGFIQHVKYHFIDTKDSSAFREAAKTCNEGSHRKSIASYNSKPNKCLFCGLLITAKVSDKAYAIKQKKFCNSSCAAKYNNTHRDKTVYTQLSLKLRCKAGKKTKVCRLCGQEFFPRSARQVFCSTLCRYKSYRSVLTLQTWVSDFVQRNNYIPTSKISSKHTHLAIRLYGSWNKAILLLGYKPYTQKYSKGKFKCFDGHIADSLSLLFVDNWLTLHKIKHLRNKRYPDSKKNCDFYLPDFNLWILYFGLIGLDLLYTQNAEEKRSIAKAAGITLLLLHPSDIASTDRLLKLLTKNISEHLYR